MKVFHFAGAIFMISFVTFALMGIVRQHDIDYILVTGGTIAAAIGLLTLIAGILTYRPKRTKIYDMEDAEDKEGEDKKIRF